MVNKRGAVLIFSLLLTLILTSLLGALYINVMSENQQANQYVNSTRAFWLAEAGISTLKAVPGLGAVSGSLGGANYTFNVPAPQSVPGTNYWIVTSTGTVNLPSGSNITRTLVATIKTGTIDATKFPWALDTTTALIQRGSVTIDSYRENDNTINFANMFSISKETMQAGATHLYTDSTFAAPVDHITWVNVASGNTLTIAGTLIGSGILVINGDVHISGTVDFDGIIYVIGDLTMTGTVTTNGAIVAESSATADTEVKGNVDVNYSIAQIEAALANVQLLNKQIVAWQEQ